jgi:hypothetical protein
VIDGENIEVNFRSHDAGVRVRYGGAQVVASSCWATALTLPLRRDVR